MTLHLVQASKQDCKKNCGPWIAANGVITPESVRQLDSMLKTLGYVPGLKIMISSPGGDFR
ncbi:MAG: hypothetical protein U1E15_00105 [Hyphomicrobiales bacterium]